MTIFAKTRLILCAAALAVLAASSPAAAQDKTLVMKLSTATLNDAQHEWMKRFAAAIDKNTGGRIKAEIYPASQLGTIPRQIEGTQLGSIQAWVGPPEFLVGVDARYEILSAPGLIQNDQHAIKIISDPEFSKAFLALGANKGLVGASLFITGPMVFDMRTPLRSLAELKGKKVRVLASPFQTEQVSRLGGTGVPLSLGDVLPALQQGTLDGAMGGLDRVQRAAISGHGEIHHRGRPRLHLQHGGVQQALVRRAAGRPQGHRDGDCRSGPRGGPSLVARFLWPSSARCGRKRAAR